MLIKRRRHLFTIFADAVVFLASWALAFALRFNFQVPTEFLYTLKITLIPVLLSQVGVFVSFGVYASLWRYVSIPDLKKISLATLISLACAFSFISLFLPEEVVPRSIWAIHIICSTMFLSGMRVLVRVSHENASSKNTKEADKLLIVGAGNAGLSLAKDLGKTSKWSIAGFVDDDPSKKGRRLYGYKILGTTQDIQNLANKHSIKHVVLALPSATYSERREVLEKCHTVEAMQVFTVPALEDIMSGALPLTNVKKLDIEELLGRDPVQTDIQSIGKFLTNKTVLVTGAGGSIGSEICRQIAKFDPENLILFEKSEPALYHLEQEFQGKDFSSKTKVIPMVGDVANETRLLHVFEKFKPHVVFHAAAYKHVPLMENGNSWEAIKNNSFGSYNVAEISRRNKVEKFIMISTDKAVRPCNVMGASKSLAEKLVLGLAQDEDCTTQFITVRFGNVLGSQGSVIPKFRKQILHGGPVTVTHPDMERFFMSIPEASQLVLQAAALGTGGEIFVLDMGTPVKLMNLAKDMIRLSGFSDKDIPIEITGLRPGEKLYEELFGEGENELPTSHNKIRICSSRQFSEPQFNAIKDFALQNEHFSDDEVRNKLKELLSDYSHS